VEIVVDGLEERPERSGVDPPDRESGEHRLGSRPVVFVAEGPPEITRDVSTAMLTGRPVDPALGESDHADHLILKEWCLNHPFDTRNLDSEDSSCQ